MSWATAGKICLAIFLFASGLWVFIALGYLVFAKRSRAADQVEDSMACTAVAVGAGLYLAHELLE